MFYFGGYGVSRWTKLLIPVDAKIWDEQDVRHAGVGPVGCLRVSRALVRMSPRSSHHASRRTPMRGASELLAWPCAHPADENRFPDLGAPGRSSRCSDGSHSPLITALLHEMGSRRVRSRRFSNAPRLVVAHTTQNPAASYCVIVADRRRELGPHPRTQPCHPARYISRSPGLTGRRAVLEFTYSRPCDSASNPLAAY